ncbi:MAG: hypothetical protein JTT11_04510 [Candidatus Brockarchaeota archaeon]|nr:hypothetical protein [Candidatus Brockarchaeota archaeon]
MGLDLEAAFESAARALEEEAERPRATTGNGELDALIGGVELGRSYLFYGDSQEALDGIVHGLLANSVLPAGKGGFGAKALYFNSCNYHRGKTVLNPSMLGEFAKRAGLDPEAVLGNVYSISAFNELQQPSAAREAAELVSRDGGIKLLVLHNLTAFVNTSRKPAEAYRALEEVVGTAWRAACESGAAVVASCSSSGAGTGRAPKPPGGSLLRHRANVIVFLKRVEGARAIRACLVKHPCKEAPDSVVLRAPEGGESLMGRITPSFRQLFESQVEGLRKNFQNALLDPKHREAFNLLLKEAWSAEGHAMSNSGVPVTLDAMNLMANVHNRKCVAELRRALEELEARVERLEGSAGAGRGGRIEGEGR